jgi:hypothetical protein
VRLAPTSVAESIQTDVSRTQRQAHPLAGGWLEATAPIHSGGMVSLTYSKDEREGARRRTFRTLQQDRLSMCSRKMVLSANLRGTNIAQWVHPPSQLPPLDSRRTTRPEALFAPRIFFYARFTDSAQKQGPN